MTRRAWRSLPSVLQGPSLASLQCILPPRLRPRHRSCPGLFMHHSSCLHCLASLAWCLHICQRVFSCVDQVFDVHVNHVDSVLHRGVFRPEASFSMWPPSTSNPTSVPLADFVHCCQGFGHVRESEAHRLRGPVLRLERDLLVSEILYLRSATRWNLLFCAAFKSGIS